MVRCVTEGQRIALAAHVIATAMAENLTASEQNVLGNLVAQIGATILSIAAVTQACEEARTAAAGSGEETADTIVG